MKFIIQTLLFAAIAVMSVGCKSEPKKDANGNIIPPAEKLVKVTEIHNDKIVFENGSSQAFPPGESVIFMVRHANADAEPGFDNETRPLTAQGLKEVERLKKLLSNVDLGGVMSTSKLRAAQTGKPVADQKKLALFSYNAVNTGRIYDFVFKFNTGQKFLVVGHSNTVPAMVNELTGDASPAVDIPSHVHDNFYVITGLQKGSCKIAKYRY